MFRGLLWPEAVARDRALSSAENFDALSPLAIPLHNLSETRLARDVWEDIDRAEGEEDYDEEDGEEDYADGGREGNDDVEGQGQHLAEDDDSSVTDCENLWHGASQGGYDARRVSIPYRYQDSDPEDDNYRCNQTEEEWHGTGREEEHARVLDASRGYTDGNDDSMIYQDFNISYVEAEEYFSDSDDEEVEEKKIKELERRFRSLYSLSFKNVVPPIIPEARIRAPRESWSAVIRVPKIVLIAGREIQRGNGLSKVVYVRSIGEQINGYGLETNSVWAMKTFQSIDEEEEPKHYARRESYILSELDAYKRIGQACDWKKIGFEFLMQLEGHLVNDYVDAFVFELMHADLRTLINAGRFGKNDCPRMMAQMAIGIATLHSIGIIHRDIKPENILIDAKGDVKITDFGLSFVTNLQCSIPECCDFTDCDEDNWQRGLVGTREYMAPEMIRMSATIIEIDYFSLGCVFFEMLTGNTLFDVADMELDRWIGAWKGGKSAQLWYFGGQIRDLNPIDPAIDLLCGLLCVDPRQRYGIAKIIPHDYFMEPEDRLRSEFDRLEEVFDRRQMHNVVPGDAFAGTATRYTFQPARRSHNNWLNPSGFFLVGHE